MFTRQKTTVRRREAFRRLTQTSLAKLLDGVVDSTPQLEGRQTIINHVGDRPSWSTTPPRTVER
jgi:hypothetical protein